MLLQAANWDRPPMWGLHPILPFRPSVVVPATSSSYALCSVSEVHTVTFCHTWASRSCDTCQPLHPLAPLFRYPLHISSSGEYVMDLYAPEAIVIKASQTGVRHGNYQFPAQFALADWPEGMTATAHFCPVQRKGWKITGTEFVLPKEAECPPILYWTLLPSERDPNPELYYQKGSLVGKMYLHFNDTKPTAAELKNSVEPCKPVRPELLALTEQAYTAPWMGVWEFSGMLEADTEGVKELVNASARAPPRFSTRDRCEPNRDPKTTEPESDNDDSDASSLDDDDDSSDDDVSPDFCRLTFQETAV